MHSHNPSSLLIFILTLGVFSIINTEMGVVGIIPLIADTFAISVPQAGWTVSAFALIVGLSAPITPLLFSRFNRKKVMLVALGVFTFSNIVAMLTEHFAVLIAARILPAFLHPVYVSMAFTVAAHSVPPQESPKMVARVFIGVSAGMVLGVPITTFIASHTSFSTAMFFFTITNAIVLLGTYFLIPSLPVQETSSYRQQFTVLNRPILWYSILTTTLINGAIFGFFSYMSDFLNLVTALSFNSISLLLFVYGASNIVGNIIAGNTLATRPTLTIISVPCLLLGTYLILYLKGNSLLISIITLGVLGILAGIAANMMQYIITQAAPDAPEFSNGLFLASANFGTMVGTMLCGFIIDQSQTSYALWGAIFLLIISMIFIYLRLRITK